MALAAFDGLASGVILQIRLFGRVTANHAGIGRVRPAAVFRRSENHRRTVACARNQENRWRQTLSAAWFRDLADGLNGTSRGLVLRFGPSVYHASREGMLLLPGMSLLVMISSRTMPASNATSSPQPATTIKLMVILL